MAVKITLKDIRNRRSLSQEKLAVLSGVSVSYIQKIEQNTIKRLSLEVLDKLCKVLGCQVSDLLEYTEDEELPA
ncbi:helix-turn-helix transcriptional regulator [Calothrix sp. FACHB-1219]|uniref:helix-turn-helix domain-containing protein n=1 Tax=unclassified Calothrix TaxID=2619626 RepID=UPI00168700E6|nr:MULTISPECIES: helix-turn-helix transcriptional regulator [unclassified Calothrix]MBD2207832.1 helix-turn-helix transcriptional regulator [Calothrix sp. FACHB-168]MBD2222432.1 helix-turn-helix transcriptional regulator [Calothrix sp. FACHB-1219]